MLLLKLAKINTKDNKKKKLHFYVTSIAILWLTSLGLQLNCTIHTSSGEVQFSECITSLLPTRTNQVQMLHQA